MNVSRVANWQVFEDNQALGLLCVDASNNAYLRDGNLRLMIATQKTPFFPVEVKNIKFTPEEEKKAKPLHLSFWKAVKANKEWLYLSLCSLRGSLFKRFDGLGENFFSLDSFFL